MSDLLRLEHIDRAFQSGDTTLPVLRNLSLSLGAGETIALYAPSGSGKSTLLHIAGLLDKPDAGRVVFQNQDCWTITDTGRTQLRRTHLGFVYQFHHLLPELTALENTMLPLRLAGHKTPKALSTPLLEALGLKDRMHHRPTQLSGGERQRVAFARALVHKPALVLMDEPTGNLDPETSDQVFDVLLSLIDTGMSAIIATHNPAIAARCTRRVTLHQKTLKAMP